MLKFFILCINTNFQLFGEFHIPQNPKIFHGIPPIESTFQTHPKKSNFISFDRRFQSFSVEYHFLSVQFNPPFLLKDKEETLTEITVSKKRSFFCFFRKCRYFYLPRKYRLCFFANPTVMFSQTPPFLFLLPIKR